VAADEQTSPVGSVAQEAARLVDAFASWAADDATGHATGRATHEARDRRATGEGARVCPECGAARGGTPAPGAAAAGAGSDGHAEAEGQEVPSTCRVCPLCQGLALLRSVRPETIDRLADLATAVADSLRAVADTHRTGSTAGRDGAGTQPQPQAQDIPVTEDDEADESDDGPDDETTDEGARA
jgi:hypothetical protein